MFKRLYITITLALLLSVGAKAQYDASFSHYWDMEPYFNPGDLTYVKAHTTTLYGKVSVYCSADTITVEIPVGCDATIQLANGFKKKVGSGKHSFGL